MPNLSVCDIHNDILALNDSLISEIQANDNYKMRKYWNRFNVPILEDQAIESFRFSITVLLADYQKIYRINKKGEVVTLHVKEFAVPTTIEFRTDSLVSESTKC